MLDTPDGFRGFSEVNGTRLPTDSIAYYQIPTNITNTTSGCANFGYFYHLDTGLCITVEQTNTTYPQFMNGNLTLAPCNTCSVTPPPDQTFCTDEFTVGAYLPYQCMAFYGDAQGASYFYGVTVGDGPQVFQASEQIYPPAGSVTCIWLLFPGSPP